MNTLKAAISQVILNETDLLGIHVFCKVFMSAIYSQIVFSRLWVYNYSCRIEAHSDHKEINSIAPCESIPVKISKYVTSLAAEWQHIDLFCLFMTIIMIH